VIPNPHPAPAPIPPTTRAQPGSVVVPRLGDVPGRAPAPLVGGVPGREPVPLAGEVSRRGTVVRRELAALFAATFLGWMGQRMTAVALPLVALAETGSAWTTGLVAGAAGLPLVTSGWWAVRLRHRIASGPALAAALAGQTLGLLVVPVSALVGPVTPVQLGICGLLSGAAAALAGPARQALTADVADRLGPGAAARALAWQDLAQRSSMIVAPPLAAVAVAASGPIPLLWCEAAGIAMAALLSATVRVPAKPPAPVEAAQPGAEPAIRIRAVLRRHRDLRLALLMSGAGGALWFAFTLGLAVLGARTGRPGVLIAAGFTGYGLGSLAGALAAPRLATRLPALPTAAAGWIVLGAVFVAIAAAAGSPIMIVVLSAIGGLTMPIGIAAVNALITERTTGSERRAAFASESIIHDGLATLGMLAGGAVIGLLGARPALVAAGLLQAAVALLVLGRARSGRTGQDAGKPAAPGRATPVADGHRAADARASG
jgi:MFS family permease